MVTEVVGECFHDLGICEFQKPRPFLDQGDANSEGREHAGVLDADDAAAYDNERSRNRRHFEDLIAVEYGAPVNGNFGRERRFGSGCDDDRFGVYLIHPTRSRNLNRRRRLETRDTGYHLDAVAGELSLRHVDFRLDHMLHAKGEISHTDLLFYPVTNAVDVLVVVTGQVKYGFAHGFTRDRAGVDANPTDHFPPFN